MNTIQTKGAYKSAQNFIEKGENISSNNTNNKIYSKYYQYLIDLGNKNNTIILKLMFIVFLERYTNYKSFKTITTEDIYNYIEECSKFEWEYSYQDNNKFLIKLFLNWSYQNNITKISGDMVLPKILWHHNSNIRTYYTQAEIAKMLNAINTRTKRGKEDYLIICLICYLGLRISDVVNLKLSNINFSDNIISIIQYKTNNALILPLINEVKYPLLDYLKNVRPKDSNIDYIFITDTLPYRQKIEIKTYKHIVKKYFEKAGVNINGRKHGFHCLRHSFSKSLLNQNVSLYSISNILGHKNIETTMSYLDIDISKLKELALEVPYVK